jgi:hypothetical protein
LRASDDRSRRAQKRECEAPGEWQAPFRGMNKETSSSARAPLQNSEKACCRKQPFIVARELHALLLCAEKFEGGEVNSIQRAHWNGKRQQGARKHWSNHFKYRNSTDQITHRIAM